MDGLSLKKERGLGWQVLHQISLALILCEMNPAKILIERRMLEVLPITITILGNRHTIKVIQVFKPTLEFNLHSIVQELEMGVLEHHLTLIPGIGQSKKMMVKIEWNLMTEAELLPPFDECPTPNQQFIINIIIWNSKGALKPNFQSHIRKLA